MTPTHLGVTTLMTLTLVAGVAALSQLPLDAVDDDARIRLSWRNEPIRVEECRALTDEDQANVPAHMRRARSCTGDHVDYELRLEVDGRAVVVDTVAPSGLRRDRPVYVLRDLSVPAGRHDVEVRYAALVPEGYESDVLPAVFGWSGAFDLEPGEVGLVTLDAPGRALVRGGPN